MLKKILAGGLIVAVLFAFNATAFSDGDQAGQGTRPPAHWEQLQQSPQSANAWQEDEEEPRDFSQDNNLCSQGESGDLDGLMLEAYLGYLILLGM